jgi:hypothetical protein
LRDDGLLRFEFHQLKGDQYGTVSGRFSATKPIGSSKGANPQQVIAVGKHRRQHGDRYCIRELYVSRTGIVAAPDAKQIEYRVFADLSRSERLRAAYARDPNTDFHEWTGDAVRRLRPDFDRKRLKIINGCGQPMWIQYLNGNGGGSLTAPNRFQLATLNSFIEYDIPDVGIAGVRFCPPCHCDL